jgi:hypothetical protein
MDMQQRALQTTDCAELVALSTWGNQRLWDLAKANPNSKELLVEVRAILLLRTRENARQAIAWIDGRLYDIEHAEPLRSPDSRRSKWGLAAAVTAALLAISGGIAHGAGVSIWHGFIKPLFVGG